jgi:hypothetical protein
MRTGLVVLLVACSSANDHAVTPDAAAVDAPAVDAPAIDAPAAALELGTVTAHVPAACSNGAGSSATCQLLSISCGAYSDQVELAVSRPASPIGTVTLHGGGAGTGYWGAQPDLITPLLAAGFQIVQLKWVHDWQVPGAGARHAACLPATAYQWIHDNLRGAGGFCGAGTSGGGATLGYSLSAYGLESIFDYAMIVSGPAVSKMDVGCDLPDYTGPAPSLCPQIPQPLNPLPASAIDGIEQTTTCSCTTPDCVLAADKTRWAADSIVTDGASYTYPHTATSFWFCGNSNTNGSTGGGAFYYAAVAGVASNDVSLHCYAGAQSTCKGEGVFDDPNALDAAVAAMTAGCIARH